MPYISDEEWLRHKREFEDMRKDVQKICELLRNVRGNPIIQGFAGKKFDLNENINAVTMLKRITDAEARLTAHGI